MPTPAQTDELLDGLFPEYDVREYHAIRVPGLPQQAFDAFKQVGPEELPLVRLLTGLRGLPARLAGKRRRRPASGKPLCDRLLEGGFVLVAERPASELVFGTVGQFWKLTGAAGPAIGNGQQFLDFAAPGCAKAAMNFRFQVGERGTWVTTETRVLATDREARRKFARYWLVISPGSGLIRRSILRAVRRRLERAGGLR
jgi:hypothetical protein